MTATTFERLLKYKISFLFYCEIFFKTIKRMKQPTAPLYPELPTADGQNYRLQKISEIEKQFITERDARKAL